MELLMVFLCVAGCVGLVWMLLRPTVPPLGAFVSAATTDRTDAPDNGEPPAHSALPSATARRPGGRLVWWVGSGCLLVLAVLFAYAQVRGWTPDKVERTVKRDLPPGSTRPQVEAFLDAQGWRHTYSDDPFWLGCYGGRVDLRAEQLSGMVYAAVPDPNVGIGGLDTGKITVFFFFDREGRLIRWYLHEWILSL